MGSRMLYRSIKQLEIKMLMRDLVFYSIIISLTGLFSCKSSPNENKYSAESLDIHKPRIEYQLSISGMSCTGCEKTIQNSLTKLNGVVDVTASAEEGNALVVMDAAQNDTTLFRSSIRSAGYKLKSISLIEKSENEHITD